MNDSGLHALTVSPAAILASTAGRTVCISVSVRTSRAGLNSIACARSDLDPWLIGLLLRGGWKPAALLWHQTCGFALPNGGDRLHVLVPRRKPPLDCQETSCLLSIEYKDIKARLKISRLE